MKIFVSNTCNNCTVVKNMNNNRTIPIDTINITEEADYIEKYNLTTVPSLLKGEKIITNIQKITEIVKGE